MARPLKAVLIGVASLLALVAAAIVVFVFGFDPNTQKGRITDAVYRATGRSLTIKGPLRLSLAGLAPGLVAETVAFANRPGGTRPDMASAARVEARLALLPLLTGRIEIARVTLVRPDILLETDAQGTGNWQMPPPPAAAAASDAPASPSRPHEPIAIRSLAIEDGRLTWHDGRTGWTQMLELPRASVEIDAASIHAVADARDAGFPAHLELTTGSLAQLTGALPGPFPVTASARLADASLTLDGVTEFPVARHGFAGRIGGTVPDLAAIAGLLQLPAMPPLRDVRFDATMATTGGVPVVQSGTLHVGASDLSRYLPGAALTALDLDGPAGVPAHLQADGTLSGAPWQISAGLQRSGQSIAVRGLSVQSGIGDLAGDIALVTDPLPALRGTLVSHRLDLDRVPRSLHVAPAIPAGPAATAASPASPVYSPVSTPISAPVFPTAPLPWGLLRQADADLQLTVDTLHAGLADYRATSAHLTLRAGRLRLAPVSSRTPEGLVDVSLTADASVAQPSVALILRAPAVALDPLALAFGLPGGSNASAELDAALNSDGQSPHDLAAHLNGHFGLAAVDGEVSNAMLAALAGPALRSVGLKGLGLGGRSHVACLAVRLDVVQGRASMTALQLDTALFDLTGTGDVDLGAETLALRLRPTLRLGGVMVPVRVDGPLARPVVAQDSPEAAGRVGVVIGGAAPPPAACDAALTAARDGRAGHMPADAAAKPLKPVDILRSFLR